MPSASHQRIVRPRAETSWTVDAARVGPYRLCLELASGGMATVYLAHAGGSGGAARFAAVKVIHPHLAGDPTFVEMFLDEAEIASRIRHANVCDVYDFEVAEGNDAAYIAMEYLLGESMAELQRKLARASSRDVVHDARRVCRALADACEGLHAAHLLTDSDGDPLDVVHRDVSPGNVMITYDGITKVVDFGVAAAARKRHRTETGMLKGKFAYIAPECLRGRKADRRSDVWAVGVLAWELVTGERLFRRDNDVDSLRAVMDDPIRRPSEVRPELPPELDAILMRALERDPDERYPNARKLGRELAQFANRDEVITSGDLAEWLEELFPGARERRLHELDLAAQLASGPRGEGTAASAHWPSSMSRPTEADVDTTRLYERPNALDTVIPPKPLPQESTVHLPRRSGIWTAAAALVVGVVAGGVAMHLGSGRPLAQAEPEIRHDAPPPAAVETPIPVEAPEPALSPELRLRAGGGLARGPYLLELVESGPDELVLRIRHDSDPTSFEESDVEEEESEVEEDDRAARRAVRSRPAPRRPRAVATAPY